MVSKLGIAFGVVGVLIGAGCELASFFVKKELHKRVEKALVVDSAEHEDYQDWLTTDPDETPTLNHVYFFNLTNVDAYLNGSAPVVESVGPYTFRKYTDKVDVSFADDGEKVTYKPHTYYKFLEAASTSTDPMDDKITMPNPTFPGLLARAAGSEDDLLKGALLLTVGTIGNSFAVDFVAGARVLGFPSVVGGIVAQLAPSFGGEDNVHLLWANGGFPAGSLPSPRLDGFVIGTLKDDNAVTAAQLARLFDPTNKLGILDKDGVGAWLTRADLKDQIIAANQLDPAKAHYDLIRAWIATYSSSDPYAALVVEGFNAAANAAGVSPTGVSTIADLGFYQWATGRGINPSVVISAVEGAPAPGNPAPEMGVACNEVPARCPGGVRLSVEQAKRVLTGASALSSQSAAVAFQTKAYELQAGTPQQQQDAATFFVTTYALTAGAAMQAELGAISAYLGYLTTSFVEQPYQMFTSPAGGAGPIATRSVREWLFYYEDPLIKLFAPTDPRSWNKAFLGNATSTAETAQYGLADTMYTGKGDLDRRRVFTVYQNETKVGELTGLSWAQEEPVRGTDATSFQPDTPKGEGVNLKAWVSFIYRAADIEYRGTSEVKDLSTFSFGIPESVLAVDVERYDQYKKGVFNLTRVRGVPLMVTKPHYLDADLEPVSGMAPASAADHDFVIEVEPITGVVIKGNKRLQYNLGLSATNRYFTRIPTGIVPMFWVDEAGEIGDDDAKTLKKMSTALWVTFVLFIGGFAAGGFFLILGVALCIFKRDGGDRPNNRGMEKMVEL